jgi:hypothetical protein
MSESRAVEAGLPEAPFRGAEPFRFIDRLIFFERKAETRQLLREVIIYRGVLLYGDSGAGKSSLINAGLIPVALGEGFTPDRVRLNNRKGGEITVERISLLSDDRPPFLSPSLSDQQGEAGRAVFSVAKFREKVTEFAEEHYPLLIFDQFEEFATLFEEAVKPEEIKEARQNQEAILELLVWLLRDRQIRVKLLFAFREDYLAKLTQLFTLSPELQQQYIRLTPPGTDSLRELITGPFKDAELAKHFGRAEGAAREGFSEKLVSDLETEFKGRSRGGVINLTEVQLACLELWRSGAPEQLYAKEQVSGLLRLHMERAIEKLGGLKEPAVALLSFMVTSQGTRNVISEYDLLAQVRGVDDFNDTQLRAALQALVQESKLVRRVILREAPYYEIISEFLAPWIAKLRREREGARTERQRRFEERSLRLARFTRYAIAIGVLLAVTGMLALFYNTYQAGTISRAESRMRGAEALRAEATTRAEEARARLQQVQASLDVLYKESKDAEEKTRLAQARAEEAEHRARLLTPKADRERLDRLQAELASLVEQTGDLQSQVQEKELLIKALQTQSTNAAAPAGAQTSPARRSGTSAPRGINNEKRRPTMFGSAMLEVAAALLILYFILGLVCVALGELLESFLNFRAAYLLRGINRLLGDDEAARHLYNHPLVRALQTKDGRLSYLPSRTFSAALLDMVAPATPSGATGDIIVLRQSVAAMKDGGLRSSLIALFGRTEELERARERLEEWYEDAMDRVSGRYRRRTGLILLVLGFVLSLGLNVDTVNIATTLSRTELRDVVAAAAESYVTANPAPEKAPAAPEKLPAASATATPTTGPTPADSALQAAEAQRRINAVRYQVSELGLPIGWSSEVWGANPRGVPAGSTNWILKIVGCLITALVVSQFALFLFDIFNRFAVIRATVRPRAHGLGRLPADIVVKATDED